MSAKLSALFAFALGAIIGVVLGCQKYDFQPVSPIALSQTSSSYSVIAKKLKPNIMLMVDNSGSMYLPIDPNASACRFADGGPCGTDYTSPSTYCPVVARPEPRNCAERWRGFSPTQAPWDDSV